MTFKRAIESVMIEHALSGVKIYDVLGGNIKGAGKAVRADVAQLDSYSEGEHYTVFIKWLENKTSFAFGMYAPKEVENFSDYEMEKFILDSINRSISLDFCDASKRTDGQLDYSWDNHVEAMCSSVADRPDYYQALIGIIDGSHDGIRPPVIHPQMARTLVKEGILELTPQNFLKFMSREEVSKSLLAFNDYVTNAFKQRFFDSAELWDGFESFFKMDFLPKFLAEPERQARMENGFSR